jgi:hypothetical protein
MAASDLAVCIFYIEQFSRCFLVYSLKHLRPSLCMTVSWLSYVAVKKWGKQREICGFTYIMQSWILPHCEYCGAPVDNAGPLLTSQRCWHSGLLLTPWGRCLNRGTVCSTAELMFTPRCRCWHRGASIGTADRMSTVTNRYWHRRSVVGTADTMLTPPNRFFFTRSPRWHLGSDVDTAEPLSTSQCNC